jgi:broad specificity phosphatase PhoE
MRLLLIRHGQTPANVTGELASSRPGPGLTELGVRQADAIPAALHGQSIDSIWVSPLIRTHLTAAPLAADRGLAPQLIEGVEEVEAGALEGMIDKEATRTYLLTAFAWGSGDLDVTMPGGSNGHAFFARFDNAIAQIAATGGDTVAIVSHGAAIRVWVAGRAGNAGTSFARHNELDNTGIVELVGTPSTGWQLVSWAGKPIGGASVTDNSAPDPTGESVDELETAE